MSHAKAPAARKPITLDAILAENRVRYATCSWAAFMPTLPAEDRRACEAALLDERVQTAAIWKVLVRYGYTHGQGTISRHRNRGCRCPR